jgi:hypothetical protein
MSFNVAEEGHVVHVYPANDPAGVVAGDIFSMENWSHASILVLKGAGSAATITVEESVGFGGTSATAIGFNYYLESTAAGDTLAAKATATSAGVAISSNSGVMCVIELDGSELSDGYNFVQVKMDSVGASKVAIAAVLSGARYAIGDTAIV